MKAKRHFNDSMEIGSWVAPFRSDHLLHSKGYCSPFAVVVSLEPFHLMSTCGKMYWFSNIKRDNFYVIDNKRRALPHEIVSKMQKFGLEVPKEALEPTEMTFFAFRVFQDDPKLEFSVDGVFKVKAMSLGRAYDTLRKKFTHASITQILDENED